MITYVAYWWKAQNGVRAFYGVVAKDPNKTTADFGECVAMFLHEDNNTAKMQAKERAEDYVAYLNDVEKHKQAATIHAAVAKRLEQ